MTTLLVLVLSAPLFASDIDPNKDTAVQRAEASQQLDREAADLDADRARARRKHNSEDQRGWFARMLTRRSIETARNAEVVRSSARAVQESQTPRRKDVQSESEDPRAGGLNP